MALVIWLLANKSYVNFFMKEMILVLFNSGQAVDGGKTKKYGV
jgi:hypothetical protein